MRKRIVIDSIHELVDYIIRNDLSEIRRKELVSTNDFVELHLTLAMYIRNKYELSDLTKVPKLLQEYKVLNNVDTRGYKEVEDGLKEFYEFVDSLFINDDEISNFVIRLVKAKLETEKK